MSVKQAEPLRLRLERVIRAERERVFAAWTQPDLLRRWSAPEGMRVVRGTLDLRVGGEWSVVMAESDGTEHEAFGEYREITAPSRLVYTHAWRRPEGSTPETLVTVEFEEAAGGTRVVLTQEGFGSHGSRTGHEEGWSSTLDRLEALYGGFAGAVAALRHQNRLAAEVVRQNVAGITHEQSIDQPHPAGNCVNWVLGHLVSVGNSALGLLRQPATASDDVVRRYARGSAPVSGSGDAERLEDLRHAWDELCRRYEAGLDALPLSRLDEPVDGSPTGDAAETAGSLLATLSFHQAYHAGQLGVLRRLLGLPGAIP